MIKICPIRVTLSLLLAALILIAAPLIHVHAKPATDSAPASADPGIPRSSGK